MDANSGDVYFKGALFLHTLRVQIDDDELFFKIIKSFYEKYKYSNASTTNFLQIVNTMTMKDYSKLFHQYLNEREVPQLEYQVEETEGDQSVMLYRFSNLDQDLSLPLEFNIGGKSIVLHPTTEVQIVQIPKNQRIIRNTRQVYVSCLPSESLRELYHGKD